MCHNPAGGPRTSHSPSLITPPSSIIRQRLRPSPNLQGKVRAVCGDVWPGHGLRNAQCCSNAVSNFCGRHPKSGNAITTGPPLLGLRDQTDPLTWRGGQGHGHQQQQVSLSPRGCPHGRCPGQAEDRRGEAGGQSSRRLRRTWGGRRQGAELRTAPPSSRHI